MTRQLESLDSRIISAYKSGKSVKRIALENHVSGGVVYKVLATAGIYDATPTSDKVGHLYKEGAGLRTIARVMGIQRDSADKYVPYISGPRRPWTAEEDAIVLDGGIPEGRTQAAANTRRHRLKRSPDVVEWPDSPLREMRLERQLTRKELSMLSDVPIGTIAAFEQGKRDISSASIDILQRLAKALECTYKDILPKK